MECSIEGLDDISVMAHDFRFLHASTRPDILYFHRLQCNETGVSAPSLQRPIYSGPNIGTALELKHACLHILEEVSARAGFPH